MLSFPHILSDAERQLLTTWVKRRQSLYFPKVTHFETRGKVSKVWLTSASKLMPDQVKLNGEVHADGQRVGICYLLLSPSYIAGGCNCLPADDASASCMHLMLLATAALKVKPAPPSVFVEEVEKRLNYKATEQDVFFLRAVENLFLKKNNMATVSDLMHPKYRGGLSRYSTVRVWRSDTPPDSAWDTLMLLAEALRQGQSIAVPLLRHVKDEMIGEVLARRNRPQLVAQWQQLCENLAPELGESVAAIALPKPPLLALCLPPKSTTIAAARVVRILDEPHGPKSITRSDLEYYIPALQNHQDNFDAVSRFLALEVIRNAEGSGLVYPQKLTVLLLGLLRQSSDLKNQLLTYTGTPLKWHEEPLQWQMDMEDETASDFLLKLVTHEGHLAPPSVVIVVQSKAKAYYISHEEVWSIPNYPFNDQLTWPQRVPAEVVASGLGQKLFKAIGKEPTDNLKDRYHTVKGTATLFCSLSPPEETEQCIRMQVCSNYGDYAPAREKKPTHWQELPFTPNPQHAHLILNIDRTAENTAAAWLKKVTTYFLQDRWQYPIYSSDDLDMFIELIQSKLPKGVDVVLQGELARLLDNGNLTATMKIDASPAAGQTDWFDLNVAMGIEGLDLTQAQIKLLLKYQDQWVRIPGKGYHKVTLGPGDEEMKQLAQMGLMGETGDKAPTKQRMHLLQLTQVAGSELLEADFRKTVQAKAKTGVDLSKPAVPTAIKATLRPYQTAGFEFLAYLAKNNFGGVLADDMGLGKTLQTLTWITWLKKPVKSKGPVLVVCPKSVVDNWVTEAEKFAPSLKVEAWTSSKVGDMTTVEKLDILVINHAQLRLRESELTAQIWLAVVIDEAQAIKNPNSQTSTAACALKASHKLALTGTPIENRLLDLWSIMRFALPGLLGSRADFTRCFESKNDKYARVRLSARVRPFLLRRTKAEVAKDLPERIEEDLTVELEGPQKTLYQAELKRTQMILLKLKTPKELDKARFNILSSLLKLRQICCDPRLLKAGPDGPTAGAKKKTKEPPSAKLQALIEQIEPIIDRGEKVLIFSQFVEMLELIKTECEKEKFPLYMLTGQTENRGDLVKKFQAHKGGAAFLISLKAGGSGLNLTAASYVIIYDPWWNPAVENQAIDRTHRIGQKNTVFAYRLVTKNTIEEKIRELQQTKAALAADVLGEEAFAQALTKSDFEFLFS